MREKNPSQYDSFKPKSKMYISISLPAHQDSRPGPPSISGHTNSPISVVLNLPVDVPDHYPDKGVHRRRKTSFHTAHVWRIDLPHGSWFHPVRRLATVEGQGSPARRSQQQAPGAASWGREAIRISRNDVQLCVISILCVSALYVRYGRVMSVTRHHRS